MSDAPSLSRREFFTSLLASGFALAVQPIMAQTAIHTDSAGLTAGEIRIPSQGGQMPGYRAQPAGNGPFPVILVVQEIFGVHEYIRDVCRRLARLGYLAVAPELYFRQGDVSRMENMQDILRNVVARVPDAQVISDLDATAAWAAANGGMAGRMGITGFCWGGRITWLYAAHDPKLKAAVAWYGRLDGARTELTPRQPLDLAAEIEVPVLGLYGGKDGSIPVADVERMQAELRKAGNPSELRIYPDASHAFHADYRPSYRKEAAEDGWRRLTEWFKAHGL